MTRGATAQAGFTLTELLVALTILSLLMVLVAAGVSFVSDAGARGRQLAEGTETLARVQDLLRRSAAMSAAVDVRPGVAFEGTADRFTLVVTEPGLPGEIGLARRVFAIEHTAAGDRLDLRQFSLGGVEAADTALAETGMQLRFAYFGAPSGDGAGTWADRWPPGPVRPRLIRLTAGGTGRDWPDLVVALPVTLAAACVREPSPPGCPMTEDAGHAVPER